MIRYMNQYLTLLRGINVGGYNKVDMKLLKKTFEDLEMEEVRTYINTGNIMYFSNKQKEEQRELIEEAISTNFGVNIRALVLSYSELEQVVEHIPSDWKNDKEQKSEVMFLWEEANSEDVLDKIPFKPEYDTVIYQDPAILWSVSRKNQGKSGLKKLVGTKYYKQMTVRNVNTTRKVFELMQKQS